jgi:hypothetical protein
MCRKRCPQHGDIAAATWLTNRFALTADDARATNNNALRWACLNGHLGVAQWLVGRFGLTVHDVRDMRAENNFALWAACMVNNAMIARFILAPPPVGLGATPPQALERELFLDATRRGL